MSRVLFVKLDEKEVVELCRAAKVGISAIERLPDGGTRLVCMSGDDAARMKRKLKRSLITDTVERQSHRPTSPLW
jgi:hypothetical protein